MEEKVYVLSESRDEDCTIFGIYTKEEIAKKFATNLELVIERPVYVFDYQLDLGEEEIARGLLPFEMEVNSNGRVKVSFEPKLWAIEENCLIWAKNEVDALEEAKRRYER